MAIDTHEYDPIWEIRNCFEEIDSKHRTLTLNETKVLIKKVEDSATKSMTCAKKGMYYRRWCNTVYYLNGVFVEIDKLKDNKAIQEVEVQNVYECSVGGIKKFAIFVMKHFCQIKEVIVLLAPVFQNTILALNEFSICLGEIFKAIILRGVKEIQGWWDKTIETIKSDKWQIASSTFTGASIAGATRALCQSAANGTAAGIAQHCLNGGLVGFAFGIGVSAATAAFKVYLEKQSKKKLADFEIKPEISAQEAEKLGLVELYYQVGELIKLVDKVCDEYDQNNERDDYALAYTRLARKLSKMRNECPRLPNTSMVDNNED